LDGPTEEEEEASESRPELVVVRFVLVVGFVVGFIVVVRFESIELRLCIASRSSVFVVVIVVVVVLAVVFKLVFEVVVSQVIVGAVEVVVAVVVKYCFECDFLVKN